MFPFFLSLKDRTVVQTEKRPGRKVGTKKQQRGNNHPETDPIRKVVPLDASGAFPFPARPLYRVPFCITLF